MATRYYPTRAVPNAIIHGPLQGAWRAGDMFPAQCDCWAYRLSTTKSLDGGGHQSPQFACNQQGNYDFPFSWRWLTPPLQAQVISGTFDCCFGAWARYDTPTGTVDAAVVRWKVHIYLADGQSVTPKAVLLNNYVDPANLHYLLLKYQGLAAPQTLAKATAAAGDVLVIEMGLRIVSSPTPVPTYPPSSNTIVRFWGLGANPAYPDAIPGDTSGSTAFVPWLHFSATLTELPPSAPPANDACADAIVIPSLPHTTAWVDATHATDTQRGVWWTFIAPTSGRLHLTAHGSNYGVRIEVYTGSCGALVGAGLVGSDDNLAAHRSQAYARLDVTAGVQYWVKLADYANGGGLGRLQVFYQPTAYQADDLFLANGGIFVLRDGQLINFGGAWFDYAPTGIGLDYTKRPLLTVNADTHTDERVLIGLHGYELVELADVYDLNRELFFIGDPWVNQGEHPAQLVVTAAGLLHAAWSGNGYLYVAGSGTLPACLNTVSNPVVRSALRSLEATATDGQPGNPFSDTVRVLPVEVAAPWAIALDEATNVLYYTSGGLYVPVGGATIKRYDLTTDTPLADVATVPLQGAINPGLKGLCLLPDGGLLVCNGTVVTRLNAAGAVVQTYTPSIAMDAQTLIDVQLTQDGTRFWVIDLWTTRLYQFDLATGAELQTVQPYGYPGTLVQMVLYRTAAPPPPAHLCLTAPPVAACWTPHAGPPTVGCATPGSPAAGCWAPHDPDDTQIGLIEEGLP